MNIEILKYINKLGAGTFVDSISSLISSHQFLIVLWGIVLIATLIFDKKSAKKIVIIVTIAISLHFIITEGIVKHLLGNFMELRVRPYLEYPEQIIAIGRKQVDASFPSSHMALTATILTIFTYFYRKIWPAATIFIFAMAFSRIHNGMHYPTDVLGGTVLGILYGLIAIYTAKLLKT